MSSGVRRPSWPTYAAKLRPPNRSTPNPINNMSTKNEVAVADKKKEQPKKKGLALSAMAERIKVDPEKLLSTLKATVFKGAKDEELLALVAVANEYGLNPLTKEIYAFPQRGGIVPVVSIDGWVRMVNDHPKMDGLEFKVHRKEVDDPREETLEAVTCKIWRKDRERPVEVTEYLAECRQPTDPWKNMPSRMLRHKALMQCARYAFGFSGITDEDEAKNTPGMRDANKSSANTTQAEALDDDESKVILEAVEVEEPPADAPPEEAPELIPGTKEALEDITTQKDPKPLNEPDLDLYGKEGGEA